MAERLRSAGYRVELLELVTTGDRWSAAGGADATRGLFVKELEEALLDGRADLAVHSAKDLPGELPDGLAVLAVPEREDPRDVLIGPPGGLADLRAGARVGTGSPRRAAQLRLARPDLAFVEIRGNVGTRLDRLATGDDFDAIVLAAAGLNRLGVAPPGVTALGIDVCVPAPGQGALAIEGRIGRPELDSALAVLNDRETEACVRAERAFLEAMGGGCREPIGGFAAMAGSDEITLTAFAASEDGSVSARESAAGSKRDAEDLGRALAASLAARMRG